MVAICSDLRITRGSMVNKPVLRVFKSFIKNKILRSPSPVILAHMVTYRCNMCCHYCVYWKWKSDEMNTEEVIRMLMHAAELGIAVYTATGGEPFLRRDMEEILKVAKDNGFFTMLVSNGLLIEGRDVSNIDLLTISLDTLEKGKFYRITGVNALDRVVDAIKWAAGRVDTCINVVLHRDNVCEVEKLVEFAERVGVGITFEPVSVYFKGCPDIDDEELRKGMSKLLKLKEEYECIWNSEQYLKLVHSGKKFRCMPHLLTRISPNGDVISPCYEVEYTNAGTVKNDSLRKIIRSERYRKGCEIALNCNNKCYLLCYVEPSMIFSDVRWAIKNIWDILFRVQIR